MFWADELAARLEGPQVVNDSKTPSGTVHVGSLRGPVILDVIVRALRARQLPTTLLYGVDDLDPMDAQAMLTPDASERWMGAPLANVPDPAVERGCLAEKSIDACGCLLSTTEHYPLPRRPLTAGRHSTRTTAEPVQTHACWTGLRRAAVRVSCQEAK